MQEKSVDSDRKLNYSTFQLNEDIYIPAKQWLTLATCHPSSRKVLYLPTIAHESKCTPEILKKVRRTFYLFFFLAII